jgi:hypothetical protein
VCEIHPTPRATIKQIKHSDMEMHAMDFDEELEQMKVAVKAAEDEIMQAVMFHESWKPTAYDESLQARMGNSYATHTFHIVRHALRREMLLALMRIWDTNKQALRMSAIADKLKKIEFFNDLVVVRAKTRGSSTIDMRSALEPKRDKVVELVRKYSANGDGFAVFERVKTLRHERLAHRQIGPTRMKPTDADGANVPDKEIEVFHNDTVEIVRLLLSVVHATAFDIASDGAGVYEHHAKFFWAAARGERTEGHPSYMPPA